MIFDNFSNAQFAVLGVTFAIAIIMGLVANKTSFCTRGAVADWVNHGQKNRMRSWLLAMAVAIAGVVVMEASGIASFNHTLPPYRGSNFAWLEYLSGGFLFGVGMTFANGCGNRTLVRIGGGNLKSLIVISMIGITAYFMITPFPGTDKTLYSEIFYHWTSKASVTLASEQDLASLISSHLGGSVMLLRTVIGIVLASAIGVYVFKSAEFRKSSDHVLAGLVIGVTVFATWYITSAMVTIISDGDPYSWAEYASIDSWDMLEDDSDARPRDVGIQSLSFVSTVAQTLRFGLHQFNTIYATVGVMAVLGVILGSFIWSMLSRKFKFEWFSDMSDFLQHFLGGTLMGIGGILGLGCTIGQGISGISTLASGSFLAFAGIVSGSVVTLKFFLKNDK